MLDRRGRLACCALFVSAFALASTARAQSTDADAGADVAAVPPTAPRFLVPGPPGSERFIVPGPISGTGPAATGPTTPTPATATSTTTSTTPTPATATSTTTSTTPTPATATTAVRPTVAIATVATEPRRRRRRRARVSITGDGGFTAHVTRVRRDGTNNADTTETCSGTCELRLRPGWWEFDARLGEIPLGIERFRVTRRGLDVRVGPPVGYGLGLGMVIVGLLGTATSIIAGSVLVYMGVPGPCNTMTGLCPPLGSTFVPGVAFIAFGFPIGVALTMAGAILRGNATTAFTFEPHARRRTAWAPALDMAVTPLAGGAYVGVSHAF